MQELVGETGRTPQDALDGRRRVTSDRKLKANRENAKKSTGPRTPRGKSFSRRNALKHGLFARDPWEFLVQREDPDEYGQLLAELHAYYEPIGRAEDLEVERTAVLWWRHKRVWRYENVRNRVALRDLGRPEVEEQEPYCKKLTQQEEAAALELEAAIRRLSGLARSHLS